MLSPSDRREITARPPKENGNADPAGIAVVASAIDKYLSGSVVNAGQAFAGHRAMTIDHFACDNEFLNAFL